MPRLVYTNKKEDWLYAYDSTDLRSITVGVKVTQAWSCPRLQSSYFLAHGLRYKELYTLLRTLRDVLALKVTLKVCIL